MPVVNGKVRRLWIVFGDQLDARFTLFRRHFDKARDAVLLMEVGEESRHVASHIQRTTLFLSAMRHYAQSLHERGVRVHYVRLDDDENTQRFESEIARAVEALHPDALAMTRPGEWRVLRLAENVAAALSLKLTMFEDPHFLVTPQEFEEWSEGRRELVMEHFYRVVRRRFDILVDGEGKPEGGVWNFDADNRKPFRGDRRAIPPRVRHAPNERTLEVLAAVRATLGDLPGDAASFNWPVTRSAARAELRDFLVHRLANFGTYQDAMVTGEPWMFHSLLSPALNLKLLDPREVVQGAVEAYRRDLAPLNAVEGFVRQIIGWREFIRGVYWLEGEEYGTRNALAQTYSLPPAYWTGDTELSCLRESLGEVLANGFGHHIQRLMVTGNFAMIAGVDPREISDWYLGMYVDAVDWVSLPNTLGMSQHADGGVVGTKPYAAGGRYIQRMSNYCERCPFDPTRRVGNDACPFTTFYWDFLVRNADRLAGNVRMALAVRNARAIPEGERRAIAERADDVRRQLGMVTLTRATPLSAT